MSEGQRGLGDLYWISAVFLLAFLGPGALQAFLPDLYMAAGDEPGTAGIKRGWVLIGLYGSFLFWRVFISTIIRRLGHGGAIVTGAATYLAFAAAMGLSRSFPVHLAAAVVMGWGAGCFWIASTAQILHTTPPHRYGFANGFRRSAVMVGLIAGYVLLGAALRSGRSVHLAAGVSIGAGALALVAAFFIPRRPVPVAPFSLGLFGRVARRPEILVIGFFLLGSAMSYGIVLSFLRDFARTRGGDTLWVGLTLVAFPLAQGLCSLAGGVAMDWFGKTRVLQIGFLAAGVGLTVALGITGVSGPSVLWLAVPTMLLGIQSALVDVGADSLAGDVVLQEHRQVAIGAMYIWRDLGILTPIVAQLAFGALPDRVDYGLVFAVFGAYYFVCAGLAGLAGRWRRRVGGS